MCGSSPGALPPERCWRRWRVFYRSGGPAASCAFGVAVTREREDGDRRGAGLGGWPSRVLCRVTGPTGLRRGRWPRLLLPITTAAARWPSTVGSEAFAPAAAAHGFATGVACLVEAQVLDTDRCAAMLSGEVNEPGDDMADLGVAVGGGTGNGEVEPVGSADDVAVRINDGGIDVALRSTASVHWLRSVTTAGRLRLRHRPSSLTTSGEKRIDVGGPGPHLPLPHRGQTHEKATVLTLGSRALASLRGAASRPAPSASRCSAWRRRRRGR